MSLLGHSQHEFWKATKWSDEALRGQPRPHRGCPNRIALQATASDFPALTAFVRRVFEIPGIAETVRFDHILAHYFDSDWSIPPRRGIVPNLTEMTWYKAPGG